MSFLTEHGEAAVELVRGGLSHRQVAQMFGVSKATVARALHALGVPSAPRHTFRRDHAKSIVKMAQQGCTHRQIAAKFGVSASAVTRSLRAFGVSVAPSRPVAKFPHEEALDLIRAGYSFRAVAARYNVRSSSVWEMATKAGVRSTNIGKPPPSACLPAIRVLLSQGYSRRYIAKVVGRSYNCIADSEAILGAPGRRSPLYRAWVARLARGEVGEIVMPRRV